MKVELTAANPTEVEADVLAMAAGGLGVRRLDALFEGRLVRAAATADPVAVVPVTREVRARNIALVKLEGPRPATCSSRRPGRCARTAAAGRSRGPSTTRCPSR